MAKRIVMPPLDESGAPALVVHRGVPYCVLKAGGQARAFVAACSHKGLALVPLRLKKGRLVCPHHGATFDPQSGAVIDDRGKDIPSGLEPVELVADEAGMPCLLARKRHRKLLGKKERRRVEASAKA